VIIKLAPHAHQTYIIQMDIGPRAVKGHFRISYVSLLKVVPSLHD